MRKSLPILTLALLLTAIGTVAMADTDAGASAAGVVNINTADASQLAMLPRVGEKVAQRIIDYRTQHGPFKKAADLMQVTGFGAKTYELPRCVAIAAESRGHMQACLQACGAR